MNPADSMRDPDAELDALHVRLHEARIYKEGKAKTEPFRGFIASYNKLQEALCKNADADIIEQHRHSALVAAPAVRAALGDHSPMETAPTANGDVSTRTGPSPERSAEHTLDAARGTAAAVKAALGNALVITATDEPKAPDPPVATEPVASTDNRQDALALVPHAAEVCAADVDNETNPASEILRLLAEIAAAYGKSLERAIRIGELLARQKQDLGHGKFLPWVRDHLPFDERTARRYMQLWEHRAELKSDSVSDLTTAYRLTAPRRKPKPDGRTGSEDESTKHDDADARNEAADGEQERHTAQRPGGDTDAAQCETGPDARPESTSPTSSSDQPANGDASTADPGQQSERDHGREQHPERDARTTACARTANAAKPPAITLKEAFPVLLRGVGKHGPDLARKIIDRIATEGGVTVWVQSDDARDDLSALEDLVIQRLEAVADADPSDARDLADSLIERLSESLRFNDDSYDE